jgi:hypothetical protein
MCEKTSAHPALQKMVLQAEEESPIVEYVVIYRQEGIDRLDYPYSNQGETRWVYCSTDDEESVAGATDAEGSAGFAVAGQAGRRRDYSGL